MRRFALYAAVTLCVCGLSATQAAERFGQWSLEQPEDFVFALSFKRSILFDDRTAASQLAFVCNQEKKDVAVLLIPLDGTFTSRHEAIPVAVQKIEEQSDQSDLMQRWENGPGYMFLESPDEQEELATLPKGQRSRGREIGSLLFPQRPGCEYANNQSHYHRTCRIFGWSSGFYKTMRSSRSKTPMSLTVSNRNHAEELVSAPSTAKAVNDRPTGGCEAERCSNPTELRQLRWCLPVVATRPASRSASFPPARLGWAVHHVSAPVCV